MADDTAAVLVIGDVMLDRRVEGRMTRVSPEAPSPVVLRQGPPVEAPGGAANVAVNLAAMGTRTLLAGLRGDDGDGGSLERELTEKHDVSTCLVTRPGVRTITKTRITCGGQQVLRLDDESVPLCPAGDHVKLLADSVYPLFVNRPKLAALVVSDYGKGTMHPDLVAWLVQTARRSQTPVYVDCKPDRLELYRGVGLYKPNLDEAIAAAAGCVHPAVAAYLADPAAADVAARAACAEACAEFIHHLYGVNCVVVTHGPSGASCHCEQETFTSSLPCRLVYDPTGAGDTFMAALVDARVRGYDVGSAVLRANTAAAVSIGYHGTYPVGRRELEQAVCERLGTPGKVVTLEHARAMAEARVADGGRVVLTNGCFRMLHQGHLATLKFAKAQGDMLIVAVNSDASIAALKGDVPVVEQSARLEMLASLSYVDLVVVFDETDVEPVVRAIKPQVLVKGAEYRDGRIPGADYVAARGGQVLWAEMLPGVSSTNFDRAVT